MPGKLDRRLGWGVVGGIVVLAALAVWAQNRLIPFDTEYYGLTRNGFDLDTYRHAVMLVRGGKPLYEEPVFYQAWFTYPPFAALALTPSALVSFRLAKWAMLALSCALLALIAWRVFRAFGWKADTRLAAASLALAAASAELEPVQSTLWWGQVNIAVMALVLLDLARPVGSRGRGFGVGLAAGIKLTPLVFLPYLLITRQWRAAAWASGSFAATVALGWILFPRDSAVFWLHAIRDTSRVARLDHIANQSVNGFLVRLWLPEQRPVWLWLLLAALALGAGLWAAKRAHDKDEPLLAVIVVGLTGCAASPFSWAAHWVWFAPAIAWLLGKATATNGYARSGWALAAATGTGWAFIWTTHNVRDVDGSPGVAYDTGLYEHYLDWNPSWLGEIASGWYLIAFLAFLVCAAVSFRQAEASSATLVSHD